MYSNWLMELWLTNSSNKKSWITATVVLFNTQVKTNIFASWWIMMTRGSITTMKCGGTNWPEFYAERYRSMCSALGFKIDKSWEAYCQILSWTSIYLASLELELSSRADDLQSRILYALYYAPNGLKWKDFSDQQETIECPDRVVRKEEHQWTLTW